MNLHAADLRADHEDGYLVSRPQAWFAFAMTFALMLFDYIDRQVIVSLFPHLKTAWALSDKQLGALVSVISIVVAVGGLPVALLADRFSRVKSIVVMATVWSLATISCMFTRPRPFIVASSVIVTANQLPTTIGSPTVPPCLSSMPALNWRPFSRIASMPFATVGIPGACMPSISTLTASFE